MASFGAANSTVFGVFEEFMRLTVKDETYQDTLTVYSPDVILNALKKRDAAMHVIATEVVDEYNIVAYQNKLKILTNKDFSNTFKIARGTEPQLREAERGTGRNVARALVSTASVTSAPVAMYDVPYDKSVATSSAAPRRIERKLHEVNGMILGFQGGLLLSMGNPSGLTVMALGAGFPYYVNNIQARLKTEIQKVTHPSATMTRSRLLEATEATEATEGKGRGSETYFMNSPLNKLKAILNLL